MTSTKRINLPRGKTHPIPKWRTSTAEGPSLEAIFNAVRSGQSFSEQDHHANNDTVAFTTHFMQRRSPIANLIAKLGLSISDQSNITISYEKIHIQQERTITLWGLKPYILKKTNALYMYAINQATNDGKTVNIFNTSSHERTPDLCRPIAFTQAINRMLASALPPPVQNCSSCSHYHRWAAEGNQGECTITQLEEHSDCPQQGHHHWCPQYNER